MTVALRTASRLAPTESVADAATDPFALVERDHREVDQLFARATALAGSSRAQVLTELADALTAHSELEETVVYPAIADVLGTTTPDLIGAAEADHGEISTLMDELVAAESEREISERLGVVQRAVLQHVTIEEGIVFPAYRRLAAPSARKKLASAVRSAKKGQSTRTTRVTSKPSTTRKAPTARGAA